MKRIALYTLVGLCLLALPLRATITILHEFTKVFTFEDGKYPQGALLLSGSTLYGMTSQGGEYGFGRIFKMQTNGTGYATLHDFTGGIDDGATPHGDLVLSGSTLYGMTSRGGDADEGTVFKMQTDGSGFALLHEFQKVFTFEDGKFPHGSLTLSGSTLYGMTSSGGEYGFGRIFKMQTDGTGYITLHNFAGGVTDGAAPVGSLTLSSSTLYGMTSAGGGANEGTIFRIQTDGSGYALLHEFQKVFTFEDGKYPHGSLTLSGSNLYGMASEGGEYGFGRIFKIQTDGSGYTTLHDFSGTSSGGAYPYGSLIISGPILYGMTSWRNSGYGTIFKMKNDGTDFSRLNEFAGGVGDGKSPHGSLVLSGSTLYGMTPYGGDSDEGVIFSYFVNPLGDDFLGTWDSQGVYYRDSNGGHWRKLASPATMIAVGNLDGDFNDDLVGVWPSQDGVWARYSTTETWAKLATTARYIAVGDMNGDGRGELLGTWDGQGVYWRDNSSGAWTKLASPATMITAGDLDGDNTDDLIGIWPEQGGVWARYSQSGSWAKLSSTAVDISCGDMNGDGRDDLLASWDGQGVYYRNSIGGAWVKMATPATQVTAGDLDHDGIDDVIGIWPDQGGVWVKYSQTGSWTKLSSTAVDIATGLMRSPY